MNHVEIHPLSSASGFTLVKSLYDSGSTIPFCSKKHHFSSQIGIIATIIHTSFFTLNYVTIYAISSFSSFKCQASNVLALFFIHSPIPLCRLSRHFFSRNPQKQENWTQEQPRCPWRVFRFSHIFIAAI